METISNVVNTVSQTATKAIWGEQNNETAGNEPVSGLQGKGTATEPYDQGNSVDPTDPTTGNETAGKEPVSGLEGKGTATEPFDLGNSADATNTATLPIREKSSSTEISDSLAARPDETNTAGVAGTTNLSDTLSKTGTDLKTDTDTVPAARPDETNTAGVAGTSNLSDALSKTSAEPKTGVDIKTSTVPAAHNEPPLAGFGGDRKIDPEDKSQLPADVSNASTDNTLTSSTPITSQTDSTSDFAKTNPPTLSHTTTPKSPSALASEGTGKEADRTSTKRSRGDSLRAVLERADMVTGLLEKKNEDKDVATDHKETSPSGEKDKVSKMEKLKEKLHIKKH